MALDDGILTNPIAVGFDGDEKTPVTIDTPFLLVLPTEIYCQHQKCLSSTTQNFNYRLGSYSLSRMLFLQFNKYSLTSLGELL